MQNILEPYGVTISKSQQGSLRRISSLGALGEGSGWDLRIRPAAPAPAPAAPKPRPKLSPSWAQAGPKVGAQKIQKIKILKIKIRSAQNVGKVWISRKKSSWPYLGPSGPIFFHGPEKSKKCSNFAYFPWWANGPQEIIQHTLLNTIQ